MNTSDLAVIAWANFSRRLITQLHSYRRMILENLPCKSDPAVAYLLKDWTALTRYLQDPDFKIDNKKPSDPCAALRLDETINPYPSTPFNQLCSVLMFT